MMIFVYTFVIILLALVLILGVGNLLAGGDEAADQIQEGEATAAMCTTQLLDRPGYGEDICDEDFVIEQDMVYTYDSVNL